MRPPYKLIVLLALAALVALAGLSCKTVTQLVQDPSDTPLVFTPAQLPEAQVGAAYSAQVVVEKTHTPVGAFNLAVGELPPGLELKKLPGENNTAEITGTPTQTGTYKFVVHVWCYGTQKSGQTGQKEYTIVVK